MPKAKTQELPAMAGKGVEPLSIAEIDKAISRYEKKKEARCAESPGEIAAKKELQAALHAHRDELPVNGDGCPFYRTEEKDYVLTETLKVRKVDQAGDEDE